MTSQWKVLSCSEYRHKGFYNHDDAVEALSKIAYTDYFDAEPNEEFPYDSARSLLCGSCQLFAFTLSKLFGYQAYKIESNNSQRFHAFCQVAKNDELYYIDARGVTTSFNEFLEIARFFVSNDYCIREITSTDFAIWNSNEEYLQEALDFAEAVIKDHEENYRI